MDGEREREWGEGATKFKRIKEKQRYYFIINKWNKARVYIEFNIQLQYI